MKPGIFNWATNDNHAAGADLWSGQPNKAPPAAGKVLTGRIPEELPPAEEFNWLMNRAAIAHSSAAMMKAKSNLAYAYTMAGGDIPQCVAHSPTRSITAGGVLYIDPIIIGAWDAVNFFEFVTAPNVLTVTVPASSVILAIPNAAVSMDIAGNGNLAAVHSRVCVMTDTVATDIVYRATTFNAGAWGPIVVTGGPALNFKFVGCDRNTANVANEYYLIGDDAGGGNAQMYSSLNGAAFVNVATFPAIALPTLAICHTHHPAGANGTDDTGNPLWAVFFNGIVATSPDLTTWTSNAHSLGVAPNKYGICYDRSLGRWYGANQATGGIYKSDDNCVTWSLLTNTLISAAGAVVMTCDQHGTVCAYEHGTNDAWVSVDGGTSWSWFYNQSSVQQAVACYDESNVDDTSEHASEFFTMKYAGVNMTFSHSLIS